MGCIREEYIGIGEDIKGYGLVLLGSGWLYLGWLGLVRIWVVGFVVGIYGLV